jgi:hypothetical protein
VTFGDIEAAVLQIPQLTCDFGQQQIALRCVGSKTPHTFKMALERRQRSQLRFADRAEVEKAGGQGGEVIMFNLNGAGPVARCVWGRQHNGVVDVRF